MSEVNKEKSKDKSVKKEEKKSKEQKEENEEKNGFFMEMKITMSSYRIPDKEYEDARNRVRELQAEFIKIVTAIEKLPKILSELSENNMVISTSMQRCIQLSNSTPDKIASLSTSIATFQNIQLFSKKFDATLKNELLVPIKTYGNQFDIILERMKECDKRKSYYSYFTKRVEALRKKAPEKQKNMKFEELRYNVYKKFYYELRDEVVEDVQKLCDDTENVILPIAKTCISCMMRFVGDIDKTVKDLPEYLETLPDTSNCSQYVIHAFIDSHEKDKGEKIWEEEKNVDDFVKEDYLQEVQQEEKKEKKSSSSSSSSSDEEKKDEHQQHKVEEIKEEPTQPEVKQEEEKEVKEEEEHEIEQEKPKEEEKQEEDEYKSVSEEEVQQQEE